jgi:hypothetical protein
MRTCWKLQEKWWVSISEKDALRAAAGRAVPESELECAGDPENAPRLIDLPGGPQFGKRPGAAAAAGQALRPDAKQVSDMFTGAFSAVDARGGRLPNPFLCYAKQVRIPRAWAGQTIRLILDNVRYHVTVRLNGRRVAHYLGGLEPHTLDVTRHVRPGEVNTLSITVGDSGVSAQRPFDPYNYTGTRLPSCHEIVDNLVHPVNYGGADRAVGSVTLEAVPAVRTDYVFADPKVSRGVLVYTAVLANDTAKPVRVRVRSEAVGAKRLLDETATIPARGVRRLTREIPWPDPILWDTDQPHLYRLRTTLRGPGRTAPLDVHTDTFGFREFAIDGHSFFLNGKKIHLHGQSGHTSPDQDWMTLEEKIAFLRAWKEEGHVVHIRLHAKPQHKEWVLAADRVGMLLTTETALWTTGFYSFDFAGAEEACYQNVRKHFMEALVRRDRNNPSVVMWSLSNEMSPITPFDLEIPKMAALTRIFERILKEAKREDGSRVIQMSSAMDFIGHLAMYNLHYPKSWSAYPDYPHTGYWLDGAFLFPWYGPRRNELPAWTWRKDKPLYFGEFTCVFGVTPDRQASLIGDIAFMEPFFGSPRANAKIWPMEIAAYRRRDVSGFCAWEAGVFPERRNVRKWLKTPHAVAHTQAIRPVAVLLHTYRQDYVAGDEAAMELSIHNDTRNPLRLSLRCELLDGSRVIDRQEMPPATYGPAENLAFTVRFRLPEADQPRSLDWRVSLFEGNRVRDRWVKPIPIAPRQLGLRLPADLAVVDPSGAVAELLAKRGIRAATRMESLDELAGRKGLRSVWLNFDRAGIRESEWRRARPWLDAFVRGGGLAILDHAPERVLADLPVPIRNGKGFAEGERLEITYGFNMAPNHPLMEGLTDEDFALWGADYYVARRCYELPEEGNAVPLVMAGTAESGLVHAPLMELAHGRGRYLVSALEILSKLGESRSAVELLKRLAAYRPEPVSRQAGLCVTDDTLRVCKEVGLDQERVSPAAALRAEVAILDGACLEGETIARLGPALRKGKTVVLHALTPGQTRAVLAALRLPGRVRDGAAGPGEYDVFHHVHPLANGMSNNYLYWIVNKAKVPLWTLAPLHPHPATALVVPGRASKGFSLTGRGAVTVYRVGRGTLVIDNLNWQLPGFDEPERPRRYVGRLLSNLAIPLNRGIDRRMSGDFETAAEKRERGHF